MKKIGIALVLSLFVPACAVGTGTDESEDVNSVTQDVAGEQGLHGAPEHLQLDKNAHAAKPGGGGSSALMTSHGGTVLTASKTMAIFWGSEWSSAAFAGDKITGLDSFFTGWGNSNYAATNTEYAGTNGQVTKASTYLGHALDTTAAPSRALTTASAVAEACKVANDSPDASALYLIYTSTGAGHVSYCAWHSWGTCSNGAPIQVAYMPNIDGIAGCDPTDTWTTHSQGLAAVASVTAHELSETITDPRGAGWFDSSGAENGDKCAWSFTGPVTLSNGSQWKLQMEWSNAAFTAGTGAANLSGQKGCLQGAVTLQPSLLGDRGRRPGPFLPPAVAPALRAGLFSGRCTILPSMVDDCER